MGILAQRSSFRLLGNLGSFFIGEVNRESLLLIFFIPNAIELRQERFLWASDLSCYDDILSWNGSIPLFCVAAGFCWAFL